MVEAALALEDIECGLMLHEYKSGVVDGEISIPILRGMSALEVARHLEQAFGTVNMRETWFTVGVRFGVGARDLEQAETRYDRHKGMYESWIHWRKMYRNDKRERTSQLIDPFIALENHVIPGIEEEYDRKVQQVILRVQWNPDNEKPEN